MNNEYNNTKIFDLFKINDNKLYYKDKLVYRIKSSHILETVNDRLYMHIHFADNELNIYDVKGYIDIEEEKSLDGYKRQSTFINYLERYSIDYFRQYKNILKIGKIRFWYSKL